jgi:hypothetical protein
MIKDERTHKIARQDASRPLTSASCSGNAMIAIVMIAIVKAAS